MHGLEPELELELEPGPKLQPFDGPRPLFPVNIDLKSCLEVLIQLFEGKLDGKKDSRCIPWFNDNMEISPIDDAIQEGIKRTVSKEGFSELGYQANVFLDKWSRLTWSFNH